MNDDKTEIIFCNAKPGTVPCNVDHMCIGNENIFFTNKARNLGIYFDCKLSMKHHINHLCKVVYLELRRIGQMSSYLSVASIKTLVSSFVLSRLDYCNSLFVNLPIETINRLQRLQNQAARITLRKPLREHVTPMLIQLHWLPVKARIEYKTAVLCFKCINNIAPSYLRDMLGEYVPSRLLRSANKRFLKPVTRPVSVV